MAAQPTDPRDPLHRPPSSLGAAGKYAGLGLQFTAIYAMRVRARLDAGGLEPRHLLDVTVKSHRNGALNPYAQHRKEVTAEEVAESRPIAEPLTLLMCSSICDGAAAAILVAEHTRRIVW